MLNIKKFAELCQCSTQTLRYYDHQGLLKPYYIDKLSGYRFYKIEQAVDFYKIKEFQTIGFTIKEIKVLISRNDESILLRIDEKIKIYQEKLSNSIKLKESYLEKINNMNDKIKNIKNTSKLEIIKNKNTIILKRNNSTATLSFNKCCNDIYRLLQTFPNNEIIKLDEDLLKDLSNKTWEFESVYQNWSTYDEFIDKIPHINHPVNFIFNIFNINENFSLFEIADFFQLLEQKGYNSENMYFIISLCNDNINKYALLYTS